VYILLIMGPNKSSENKLKEIAMNCACFNTRKAARVVTQLFDETFKPSGLRGTQFTVLVGISIGGKVTVSQLARRLVMDRTTLTRDLKPLEKKGLVRILEGDDRRTRLLGLTVHGREVLVKALPFWEKAQKRVLKELGEKGWSAMVGNLSALISTGRVE